MASSWGRLSKTDRAEAARRGERWGLSRDAVRGRFNRGTYNPLSSDPLRALPREVRRYADVTPGGDVEIDWRDAALNNMRLTFSDYFKYNDQTVVYLAEHMSDRMAEYVATSSEDDLLRLASLQPDEDGNPPPIEDWGLPEGFTLDDVTIEVNGEWYNPFWYH